MDEPNLDATPQREVVPAAAAEVSQYLTYAQASRYCSVERTTLWRAVRAGRLRASGPGTIVRFHRTELDRWMNSRGNAPKVGDR